MREQKNEHKVQLAQTFTSTTGITLKYPEGWLARDGNGNIEMGNNQQGLDNAKYGLKARLSAGTFDMALNFSSLPGDLPSKPITEVLRTLIVDLYTGDFEVSDIKAITITGKEAARADVNNASNKTEAVVILIKWDDANFLALFGIAYQGELSQYEATIQQIAASITYQAPPTLTPASTPTTGPTFTPLPPTTAPIPTQAG